VAEPCASLALRLGDFARGHLDEISARQAWLRVSPKARQVEPFMGFDEVDRDATASRRKCHAKFVERLDAPASASAIRVRRKKSALF
jgi:hypothetical protein